MSKKEELKMVFDFLIEMLKEETPQESIETKKELLTEEVKEDKSETTPFDFDHVLNLMKKVDSIQDERAKFNSVINQTKKIEKEKEEIIRELKRVKEKYEKSVKLEKTNEESDLPNEPLVALNDEMIDAINEARKGTVSIIDEGLKK
jgi:hypothetical protein